MCSRHIIRHIISIISIRHSFFLSFLALTSIVVVVNYLTIKQLSCDGRSDYQTALPTSLDIWNDRRFLEPLDLANITANLSTFISNASNESFSFGRIIDLAPHLRDRPFSAIEPKLLISRRNRYVKLAIGVPTVKREEDYLFKMLISLIKSCSWRELNDILVIVFIAELHDSDYVTNLLTKLRSNFDKEINEGIIEIVIPPFDYYPNFKNSSKFKKDIIYNDNIDRIKWRSKQSYDISYLMNYAKKKAPYFLQLEDDVLSRTGFVSDILSYLVKVENDMELRSRWFCISFSTLGFIGKLFRTSDLNMFISEFLIFAELKPIDIVLDNFIEALVCDMGRPRKECQDKFDKAKIIYSPSLFQHIGVKSSLRGKIQNLKDEKFEKTENTKSKKLNKTNPPANVSTSLQAYSTYDLNDCYKSSGENIFWSINSNSSKDFILIQFEQPFLLKNYIVWSGNGIHPDDTIPFKSTLEIQLSNDNHANMTLFSKTSDNFYVIDEFQDSLGRIDNMDKPALNITISSVRISIHGPSKNWILISELGFY